MSNYDGHSVISVILFEKVRNFLFTFFFSLSIYKVDATLIFEPFLEPWHM